jgi:hypothetical protein
LPNDLKKLLSTSLLDQPVAKLPILIHDGDLQLVRPVIDPIVSGHPANKENRERQLF